MKKSMLELIEEGIAHTTSAGDTLVNPYRVVSWLYHAYPEDSRLFSRLPRAQDVRDYLTERNGRQFELYGSGDYSFYIEHTPLLENAIQPPRHTHKKGGQEVPRVPVRIVGGRFAYIGA